MASPLEGPQREWAYLGGLGAFASLHLLTLVRSALPG